MYIASFEWDERNEMHIAKHRVVPEEAEEIFIEYFYCRKTREERYLGLGQTFDGRYLTVAYVLKSNRKIRIITARNMDKKELRFYKKWRGE